MIQNTYLRKYVPIQLVCSNRENQKPTLMLAFLLLLCMHIILMNELNLTLCRKEHSLLHLFVGLSLRKERGCNKKKKTEFNFT